MPAPRASARAQRQAARVAANRRPYVKSSDPNRWGHDRGGGLGPAGRIDPATNADVRQAAALKAPVFDSIDRAIENTSARFAGDPMRPAPPGGHPRSMDIGNIGPIPNPPSNRTNREFVREVSGSGRMRADDPGSWR